MTTIRRSLMAAGLLVGLTAALTTSGFSQGSTKVGVLTCQTSVRLGLIIASRQRLHCQFKPGHGGSAENYFGHVFHVGPELSFSAAGVMAFEVLASTTSLPHGGLTGAYLLPSNGRAARAPGVGAKALVRGSHHQPIALEPLPLAGVNLAVAVAGLRLRSAY